MVLQDVVQDPELHKSKDCFGELSSYPNRETIGEHAANTSR